MRNYKLLKKVLKNSLNEMMDAKLTVPPCSLLVSAGFRDILGHTTPHYPLSPPLFAQAYDVGTPGRPWCVWCKKTGPPTGETLAVTCSRFSSVTSLHRRGENDNEREHLDDSSLV